ncbi:family 16 glycosylhydrolase [Maribacter sp. ANRC-HE7]|uniref:Family 16 glycosylhydrolase n=1 Tax=Maribacter aquimaris TaxID=2737171 RepID=A0ABR7UZS6_9FLAO|nr:family 16 glycosylhydrolase [Maribacter aquimaris]MBD0777806.1 family 16 glycosylhydrolase [Maribacter aquimaris]
MKNTCFYMRRNLLLILVLFSIKINAQQSSAPTCPMGGDWKFSPEFSDEFNEFGLDKEKWMDLVPVWYGRQHTRALFSPKNVKVQDSTLQLTCDIQKPEEVTYENKLRSLDKFTIAIIKSKERVKYGYFEARCKSMSANVSNAFFLYDPLDPPSKYKEGSFSEEIDIFEIVGNPTPDLRKDRERVYSTTVHRFVTPYLEGVVNLNRPSLPNQGAKKRMPFDFSTDFHIYGFLWTPDEMKWFVDGVEVFSRSNDYFKTALHIVFDCETLWGVPDSKDLPNTFQIDYIRVWKLRDNH